jgi:hypothetical protein
MTESVTTAISLLSRPTWRTIPVVAPTAYKLASGAGRMDRAGTLRSSNASCAQAAWWGNGNEGGDGGGTRRSGDVFAATFNPSRVRTCVLSSAFGRGYGSKLGHT